MTGRSRAQFSISMLRAERSLWLYMLHVIGSISPFSSGENPEESMTVGSSRIDMQRPNDSRNEILSLMVAGQFPETNNACLTTLREWPAEGVVQFPLASVSTNVDCQPH